MQSTLPGLRLLRAAALPRRASGHRGISWQRSASGSGGGGGGGPKKQPADALQSSLADLSQKEGREAKTNNLILGPSESEEKWRELDQQVNEYPSHRTFKAIGDGGDSFVASMRAAVEAVVGSRLHEECIITRLSSNKNYISVTVGPVLVETPDQVLAIYEKMRADTRLRFFF